MTLEAIIRRERIEDCLGHAPRAAIGGIINAALGAVVMWHAGHHGIIGLWLIAVVAIAALRVGLHVARRRAAPGRRDDRADARRIAWLSLLNGIAWGGGIALGGMVASPGEFLMLAALTGGMMGAAVLINGSMACAALFYMGPVAIGGLIAWSSNRLASPLAGLVLAANYLLILVRGAFESEALFIRRIETREELRDSAQTVRLLLNEFEAQSSDWIWQLDREARIISPSHRFAEAAGRAASMLEGCEFVALFDDSPARAELGDHLRHGRAFRDLSLPLTLAGVAHWWTLSAQPTPTGELRGVASDTTEQRRAEARVNHLANFDELTELANRAHFNHHLDRALGEQGERPTGIAILCLDLDRFKSINDSLGHPIGDRLLCAASRRLEEIVRGTDLVARLGGDEFAIMIADKAARRTADAVAGRIVEAMRNPFLIDGMQIMTGASVGIAVAEQPDCDAAAMMKRADLALYRAKALGRGCFAHFEPEMESAARERRMLEIELRSALGAAELAFDYQPIVDLASNLTVGCEALLRWHHPARGLVMPNRFIPIAEETGLIVQIGEWGIREAGAMLAELPPHLRIAVNLSPVQLQSAGLVTTVLHTIATFGIEPHRLELEITENVFLQDNIVNSKILHRLRDIGVKIALDDFGTGYSSLNYLRSFPFDKIKIDRCFISELTEREESRNIVRSIIGLSQSLGMITTAEGVEHQDQLAWLRAEGCTEAQGFLFESQRVALQPRLRPAAGAPAGDATWQAGAGPAIVRRIA